MRVSVPLPRYGDPSIFYHASARVCVNENRIEELWFHRLVILINRDPQVSLPTAQHRWLRQLTKIHREIGSWRKVWLAAITPMGNA